MTFGQHLEELRKRILFALLYVVVGVAVALAIEKPLMQITLKPHQQAFRKAQKKKLLERLDTHLEDLRAIGVSPDDSGEGGRFSDTDWQVLFKGEVKRKAVLRELSAPFESFAGKIGQLLPSLPQEERALFEEAYREQGASLAAAIDERFATLGEFESVSEIPRRFKTLENNLRALKKDSSRTDDFLLGGWGDDLAGPIRELEEFNQSLASRRKKVSASEVTIEKLEENGSDSKIIDTLLGSLRGFDEIVGGMQATEDARIMVISYLEQFYTHLKVAIIFGLLLTFPFVLYEAWKFVGAGLYKSEQRYVLTFLPFSMVLFALGAFFGYAILIPVALTFLATWGGADIDLAFTLGNYIGLFFTLTLVLGLVFQTPLVMVFLNRTGIVSVQGFRKSRRMAILIGFIASAFLTPPDPFSLLLMACPLVLLYEIGILVSVLMNLARKRNDEEDED
jgi:Tat protein translocase TatC